MDLRDKQHCPDGAGKKQRFCFLESKRMVQIGLSCQPIHGKSSFVISAFKYNENF